MNALLTVIVLASPIGTVGPGGGAGDKIKPTPGSVPPAPITALDVNPAGTFALTGSARGELRRYALKETLSWDAAGKVEGAVSAIHWETATAYVATDNGRLYALTQGSTEPRLLARAPARVRALALYGELLISGGDDALVRLWSLKDGAEVGQLKGHKGPITGLAVQEKKLWSTSWDRTLREWKLLPPKGKSRPRTCGKPRFKLVAGPREACGVAASGERVLTTCWDGWVRLWEAGKKKQKPTLLGKRPNHEWTSRVVASGERAVALAPAENGLLLIELGETPRARLLVQQQTPSAVDFAGDRLIVGRMDGTVGSVALPAGDTK